MYLERIQAHCLPPQHRLQEGGQQVAVQLEQVGRLALGDKGVDIAAVLDGADEVLILGKHVGGNESKHDCRKETANESFPSLFRRQLN